MNRAKFVVALIALQLVAGSAMAAEKCRPRHLAVADLPGLELGTLYEDAEAQIPKGSGCPASRFDGCEFVDRWGYLNAFTEAEEGKSFLFARFAKRDRQPPLPYGVGWSDGPTQVSRKLKALGQKPGLTQEDGGSVISVSGCFRGELGDGFWSEFHFDKAGRLIKMKRAVLYP